MEFRLRRAHLLDVVAVNWPPGETAMVVIMRLFKILSRVIAEAKLRRVARELTIRGISYPPGPRSPRD